MRTATERKLVASSVTSALLTINEAADFLRVSTRTVFSLTRPRGPIPCVRCGPRGVRYTMAALHQFIAQQEGECSPEDIP